MPGVAKRKEPAVMRMYLEGMTNTEIAGVLGCSDAAVSQTVNSPDFQERAGKLEDVGLRRVLHRRNEIQSLVVNRWLEILLDPATSAKDVISVGEKLADRFGLTKETSTRILVEDGAVSVVLPDPENPRDRLDGKK